IPSGQPLQLHLALNRLTCVQTVGMKVSRAMIALDHSHRPAGPKQPEQNPQSLNRPRQMLQDETHKHMIKGLRSERQMKNIALLKLHVSDPGRTHHTCSLVNRSSRNIYGNKPRMRASSSQRDSLRPDATT